MLAAIGHGWHKGLGFAVGNQEKIQERERPDTGSVTKHVFVTGGVVSSLGKGITAASLGRLLKSRGYTVTMQKLDPYLNVDPGTMSPFQHGEVFVTEDGAETDLDLGHYERFVDEAMTADGNVTSGSVYDTLIQRERRGDFLGGTVQVVPHVTNEIKRRIKRLADDTGADFVITEVGGTVGDIESLPFIEAIRQMRKDAGRENTCYVHVTLVPYLKTSSELKTKPTQHSVQQLRSQGVQPDFIVCRCDQPLARDITDKIALFCDVEPDHVLSALDASSIYAVPQALREQDFDVKLLRQFGMEEREPDLSAWNDYCAKAESLTERVRIALVGKYVQLPDAYLSVHEALTHSGVYHNYCVDVVWVDSETITPEEVTAQLGEFDGILVPGGFGYRGAEGKIAAAQYARENKVPYLGVCLGLQMAVAEFARHVAGLEGANSTEFDADTPHPVIDLMPEQEDVEDKGGTMRLGRYPLKVKPGTLGFEVYGSEDASERHRHRYEVNNEYRDRLEAAGLVISGTSPDGRLVEMIELPREVHPWFVGNQGHPEFKSRAIRPAPLFRDFVGAAVKYHEARKK
ncbi:MAG: CTP synthase [Actinomycetes bacterium]|jgi:CTP synthase|nr:CTP synthase [Actinomycetes bacterium]